MMCPAAAAGGGGGGGDGEIGLRGAPCSHGAERRRRGRCPAPSAEREREREDERMEEAGMMGREMRGRVMTL